jgi:hypothetical protein
VQRPFCSISFAFDFVCAALKWTDPLGFGLDEFEKLRDGSSGSSTVPRGGGCPNSVSQLTHGSS